MNQPSFTYPPFYPALEGWEEVRQVLRNFLDDHFTEQTAQCRPFIQVLQAFQVSSHGLAILHQAFGGLRH